MKYLNKSKGYTLVELSIVIIILGLIFTLFYKYYPRANEVQQRTVETSNTEYIDNALVGFAYAHGRLPYPDTDLDGIENVLPGVYRGTIPEITLGLAEKPVNKSNIPLVYSIFRKHDDEDKDDADLVIKKDRLGALLPNGTRVAALTFLGQRNTIDFCYGLRNGAKITINDSSALHVSELLPVTYNRNVAYVIVDPGATDADGDGNLLDGFNSAGLKFEVANKLQGPGYDDQVNTMEFSELFGALSCGSVISAALHAHDNAVLAADMMSTSFDDYSNLLDLTEQLAEADVVLGAAAILQAAAGLGDVTAAAATAVAESLTPPLTAIGVPAMVEIAIAAGLAVLSTAAAIITEVYAANALDRITDAKNCFNRGDDCEVGSGDFLTTSTDLTRIIRRNAVAADAADL